MRKTLLTLALLGSVAAVNAETGDAHNQSYFGIRASLDIPCPKMHNGDVMSVRIADYKNGIGVELQGIYNFPLVSNLYLEPGVGFYYDTYKDDSLMISESEKADAKVGNFGFRLPVMVGYRFDLITQTSLSVFTGPMLDVGITSKYRFSYMEDGVKIKESFSLYDNTLLKRENRVDCKWMFGAGLTFSQGYYVSISGGVGLVNICKYQPSLHENLVKFTVGYNF